MEIRAKLEPESNHLLVLKDKFLLLGFPQKRLNYHTALWQRDGPNWEETKEIFLRGCTPQILQ